MQITQIKSNKKTEWIKDVQYFTELPSTQDYALDLARQGAPEGTLVLAGRQTRGRGRRANVRPRSPGCRDQFLVVESRV